MSIPRICLTEAEAAESLGMTAERFGQESEFFMPRIYVGEAGGTISFVYPVKELQEWASEHWQSSTLFECAWCGKHYQIDSHDPSPDKTYCEPRCREQDEEKRQ